MFNKLWQWLTGNKAVPVKSEPEPAIPEPLPEVMAYQMPPQRDVLFIEDLPLRAPKDYSYIIDGERWVWDGTCWCKDESFRLSAEQSKRMMDRARELADQRVKDMRRNWSGVTFQPHPHQQDDIVASLIPAAAVMSSIEDVHVRAVSVDSCDIEHTVHSSPSHDHGSNDDNSWSGDSSCD